MSKDDTKLWGKIRRKLDKKNKKVDIGNKKFK